jgi:hypothetical protein
VKAGCDVGTIYLFEYFYKSCDILFSKNNTTVTNVLLVDLNNCVSPMLVRTLPTFSVSKYITSLKS